MLIGAIFSIDVLAPEDFVVPMFYVVPILLFTWGGRCWEPAVVAALASVLTLAGLHIDNPSGIPATAVVNRSLEIVGIWLAAAVVTLHRVRVLWSKTLAARERAERQDAERRLREQAALTHLGKLAAVVAHEVRNPLAGVRGSLEVLKSRLSGEMQERAIINTMIERLDALNAKVTDILVYARPTEPRIQDVDLRAAVIEAGASARAATGFTAPAIVASGSCPYARADPEMLRPALLNLLLNAYQAGGNSEIHVVLSSSNGTCTVEIADRGPGIPPALRERVFEPFFTTKPEGTGLGLPVVRRLVQLQGGGMSLRDHAGGGTIAELTLPAA